MAIRGAQLRTGTEAQPFARLPQLEAPAPSLKRRTPSRSWFLCLLSLAVVTLALVGQIPSWTHKEPEKYLCYVIAALVASGLKVRRPGREDEVSMNFIFVLLALLDLNLEETFSIASLAVLILAVAKQRTTRENLAATLTTLLATGASVLASQIVYHLPALSSAAVETTVRFAAAATAAFLGYHLPLVALAALTRKATLKDLWQALYLWTLPYQALTGGLIGLYSTTRTRLGWQSLTLIVPFGFLFYQAYRNYLKRLDSQRQNAQKLQSLYIRTIETLAMAIGAKDRRMENHLHRVQIYALEIGRALRLSKDELAALEAAALLHDIGKLAVPDHIISKPGRLTPEEFDRMRIHPVVGAAILNRVQFPYPVVPYVRHHHERWDGSGYPDGLQGEDIPIGARILAAVDCLDALASDRQYRRSLPLNKAVEQVAAEAGRSFDPRIVAILRKKYQDFERLTEAHAARETGKHRVAGKIANEEILTPFDQVVQAIGDTAAEVQSLFELTQELGNSLNLAETFAVLGPVIQRLVPYRALVIYLKRGGRLTARHLAGEFPVDGYAPDTAAAQLDLELGEGVSGVVAATGSYALNEDPGKEAKSTAIIDKLAGFRSLLAVPLTGAESILGCMTLYSDSPNAFTSEHLRRLQALLPKLSQAIENGLKFKQAEDHATTDHLTGLPNAHSLYLHLDQELTLAKCMNSPLTVVVCDLNGFKAVNDTYGHLTGNKLLQVVAEGLKDRCREYDFVARMGGDEFVLVLTGLATPQDVQMKITQLREAIRTSAMKICREGLVGGSFGASMFPKNGVSADELLANADRAMYRDKEQQKKGDLFSWNRHTGPVAGMAAPLTRTPRKSDAPRLGVAHVNED